VKLWKAELTEDDWPPGLGDQVMLVSFVTNA